MKRTTGIKFAGRWLVFLLVLLLLPVSLFAQPAAEEIRLLAVTDGVEMNEYNENLKDGWGSLCLLAYLDKQEAAAAMEGFKISGLIQEDTPVNIDGQTDGETSFIKEKETPFAYLRKLAEGDKDSGQLDDTSDERRIDIAMIDTGADAAEQAVSLIGDTVEDEHGHGTLVCRHIRELYPDAGILSVKVFDASGEGTVSSVCAGIQYAVHCGVHTIFLPSGLVSEDERPVLDWLINRTRESGIRILYAGIDPEEYSELKIEKEEADTGKMAEPEPPFGQEDTTLESTDPEEGAPNDPEETAPADPEETGLADPEQTEPADPEQTDKELGTKDTTGPKEEEKERDKDAEMADEQIKKAGGQTKAGASLMEASEQDLIIGYKGGTRISRSSVINANKNPELVDRLVPLVKSRMLTKVTPVGLTRGFYRTSAGTVRPVAYLKAAPGYHTYSGKYVVYRTANYDIKVTILASYNEGTVNAPLALALDNVAVSGRYRFFKDEELTTTDFETVPSRGTYTALLIHADFYKSGTTADGTYLVKRIDYANLYTAFTDIDNSESHRCLNEPFYPENIITADPAAFDKDDSNSGMFDYIRSDGDIYSQFPADNKAPVLNVSSGADVFRKTSVLQTEGLDLVYGFRSPANSGIELYTDTGNLTIRKNLIRLGTGNLKIKKTVVGEEPGERKSFTFDVYLTDRDGNPVVGRNLPWSGKGMSGTKTTDEEGHFSIMLAGGEEAVFRNVPAGTGYRVCEQQEEGYTTSGQEYRGQMETVAQSGEDAAVFSFTVTIRDPQGKAAAYLSMPVSQAGKDELQTDRNGRIALSVKAGESVTLYRLPAGYTYEIEEEDLAGYTNTASEGETGQIPSAATVVSRFTNRFDPPEAEVAFTNTVDIRSITLPAAGSRSFMGIAAAGLALTGAGCWLLNFSRGKKRQGKRGDKHA